MGHERWTRPAAEALLKDFYRIARDDGGFDWRYCSDDRDRERLSRMDGWANDNACPTNWADLFAPELARTLTDRYIRAMLATNDHPGGGRRLEEFILATLINLQARIKWAGEEPGWTPSPELASVLARMDLMLVSLQSARQLTARSDKILRRYAEAIAKHGFQDAFRTLLEPDGWISFTELETRLPNPHVRWLIRELVFFRNDDMTPFMFMPNKTVDDDGTVRGEDWFAFNDAGMELMALVPESEAPPSA